MAEQTFRSPGFFEREIDLTGRTTEIEGVPAGVIGMADKGPAFVPVTLGSFIDFERKFGTLNPDHFGPYAVNEWLAHRTALTYIRVLGAGANSTSGDISVTMQKGTVKNAGFSVQEKQTAPHDIAGKRAEGGVVFLGALHTIDQNELAGYPIFTDNNSFNTANDISLIRGMIFNASGSRVEVMSHDATYVTSSVSDQAAISSYDGSDLAGTFKLVVSSALGTSFANDEGNPGLRIYTASLDPTSKHYVGKILNTNPDRFHTEQHLLYGDFSVESEIAKVKFHATEGTVAVLSGSAGVSKVSGDTALEFKNAFGRFDTRYQASRTTPFISQPFGSKEYDLFHFECLDDGTAGNSKIKVSISNLRRSTNPKSKFGTFTVLIRDYNDTDTNMKVLEQYPLCTLDPGDENYIAAKIGDMKVKFNFDAETESERRLNVTGKRPNRSRYVRVIMNSTVEDREVPQDSLPFGFRGLPVIKTTDNLTDTTAVLSGEGTNRSRLAMFKGVIADHGSEDLKTCILPPVPMRFKASRGAVKESGAPVYTGEAGDLELADNRFFWGIKFETVPLTGSIGDAILSSNASSTQNPLLKSYGKFLGIEKLDVYVTGSGRDAFSNNKFSLSKVAFQNQTAAATTVIGTEISTQITGTLGEHMREAAYIRNGILTTPQYTISDTATHSRRITFASLAAATDAKHFNRFTDFMKFTNMFYGGFDGLNILDPNARKMNDKSSAVDGKGLAGSSDDRKLNLHNFDPGQGKDNNIVSSYRTAAKIITDPLASRVNLVVIPGIREPFVTDFVADLTRDYSKAMYVMDIPEFDDTPTRLFDGSSNRPNVRKTVEAFEGRAVDNNYSATYFPDVVIEDPINREAVTMPASIAAVGALAYNDAVAYPWFAPAGFNRGALDNVTNTQARLTAEDRNVLYDARINPIANFPDGGFVIFGQKTLQQARSALDRVNVRRMLLEVKRIVSEVANRLIFEQNTPSTRARFVAQVTPLLATIQAQQGIDQFKVVMDSSNNTQEDIEQNKLNGKIVLVPTRAVEFIAIDFIITNSGVSFE